MNDLEYYFYNNKGPKIYKWDHYFDIYDRHFSKYRNKDIVILEIGVYDGGSLLMWKNYFGRNAKIYGIDIDPRCLNVVHEENIEVIIGSQNDTQFLRNLKKQLPKIDILIDDGSHQVKDQIITFEELFYHIEDDGIYLCEDLHTSYWKDYGGEYKNPSTFIEYMKTHIDKLNAYNANCLELPISNFTQSTNSIHFYDSVVVIEKQLRKKPNVINH